MKLHFLKLFIFVMSLSLVQSCSRNPVTGKRQVMFMSEDQEIALGKQSDPQVVATYGVYEDAKLQSFIQDKGQKMAAISHRPHLNYEFKILDSPVVNAFAVPGGYVYFTRGIMAHFNNEAEFAGVLGHEIGHITARHSAQQYSKQMLGNIALIGGLIVSPEFRNFANEAQQAMGLLFMKFSRDHESQSDELGVEYSTAIGYDAVEMAEFYKTLSRLQEKSGSTVPTFLSTHPNPANRYQNVKKGAQEIQKEGVKYEVNRDEYLARIDGIIYGDDPRQGFVDNSRFYHPELKFYYEVPNRWKLVNTPSMVQMGNEKGDAVITFTLAQGTDLRQAANEYAQKNKLQVTDSGDLKVNGFPAFAMISDYAPQAQQGQQQQKPLRMLTYFIKYDGRIYLFHGMTYRETFNSYYNTFERTMRSFDRLTDSRYLNRQPDVVRIRPVRSNGTFKSVLAEYGVTSTAALTDHVILNGMELNESVKAGDNIKIIEKGAGNTSNTTTKSTSPSNTAITPSENKSGSGGLKNNTKSTTTTKSGTTEKNPVIKKKSSKSSGGGGIKKPD